MRLSIEALRQENSTEVIKAVNHFVGLLRYRFGEGAMELIKPSIPSILKNVLTTNPEFTTDDSEFIGTVAEAIECEIMYSEKAMEFVLANEWDGPAGSTYSKTMPTSNSKSVVIEKKQYLNESHQV